MGRVLLSHVTSVCRVTSGKRHGTVWYVSASKLLALEKAVYVKINGVEVLNFYCTDFFFFRVVFQSIVLTNHEHQYDWPICVQSGINCMSLLFMQTDRTVSQNHKFDSILFYNLLHVPAYIKAIIRHHSKRLWQKTCK